MDTPLAAAIHKENVQGEKATVTMKPDKLKTAKTTGKKRKASADLRRTYIPVAGASKDVDLKQKSAMEGNEIKKNQMTQGKQHADRTTKKHHILIDEEIKQCREWGKYEIEKGFQEDDERQLFLMKSTIPGMMASLMGVPISKLERPSLSDEEGYKTDGSDFDSSKLVPGPDSLVYTSEELDDDFVKVGMFLEDYPFPELKPDDD